MATEAVCEICGEERSRGSVTRIALYIHECRFTAKRLLVFKMHAVTVETDVDSTVLTEPWHYPASQG